VARARAGDDDDGQRDQGRDEQEETLDGHPAGQGSRQVRRRRRLLRHGQDDELRNARRLPHSLEFDDGLDGRAKTERDLLDLEDAKAAANAAPGGHRRGEPDTVRPVVDRHRASLRQNLSEHRGTQREREEAVRDGRAERAGGGALRVGVDPLRIVRRRGESIDSGLGDLDPRSRPELRADELAEVGHAAARSRSSVFSRPSSSMLSYRPGDTRDPVTATLIGRYTVRGFSPRSSQSCLSAASSSATVHGSTPESPPAAAAAVAGAERRGTGSASWDQKA